MNIFWNCTFEQEIYTFKVVLFGCTIGISVLTEKKNTFQSNFEGKNTFNISMLAQVVQNSFQVI